MIQHTVVFRLKHAAGSAAEKKFLQQLAALAEVPGVQDLKQLRQVSDKNPYDFGLSMYFADMAAYQGYNDHPSHTAFVNRVWLEEVAEFMEIDYEVMDVM